MLLFTLTSVFPLVMKKFLIALLSSLVFGSWLHAQSSALASIPFGTSQAQFTGGDSITIQTVLASSPALAVGDTVVVRGTYSLQTQASANLGLSITTSSPTPYTLPSSSRQSIAAGSGSFELQIVIPVTGTYHVTFYSTTSGSSFGGIYFASGAQTGTTAPTTPATPTTPPIDTRGVSSVAFGTSKAQFAAGDSITILQVLSTSPQIQPGDTVLVRGTYTLQSAPSATLLLSLTANAPGFVESTSPSSRTTVNAGSGTFELAFVIQQPGALHVTFYPSGGGSFFGGVYFAPPSSPSTNPSSGPALVSPSANTGLLGNLSIRSLVSPGGGSLIAGVTVADHERYVLIRAVGPTLAKFGVTGVLAKPTLSVYDASGTLVASTGSWTTSFSATQRAGIALLSASVGAFALADGSDDAVLHLRLVPGGYTITVSSADGGSGAALMEVYASSTFSLPAQ